jgi:hypothetical protein
MKSITNVTVIDPTSNVCGSAMLVLPSAENSKVWDIEMFPIGTMFTTFVKNDTPTELEWTNEI